MKKAWKFRKLGDVCQVIGGGTPSKSRAEFYGGDIPWASIRDMRQEWVTETEHRVTAEAIKSSAANIIPEGNVVIATRVGLGKVCMLSQDTAINQDIRGIVPISSRTLDSRFLFWWFKSVAHLIVQEGTGATVQGVKVPFVKALQIPELPMAEQRRIVSILDEAFDGIAIAKANAEKNLQNTSDIFDGYLQSVFLGAGSDWALRKLGEICGFVRGPFGGSLKKSVFVADGYAVYEQQHAIYDQFNEVRYFVGEDKFQEMRRFELVPGDLIMSCSGTMGRVAIVPDGIKRGIINQALLKLTPSAKVLAKFLKLWMDSKAFQDSLKEYSGGAAIQNVASVKILKEIKLPLPSIAEQNRVVKDVESVLSETTNLEFIYQRKLAALDELKQSLLHQAFSGAL